MGSALWSENRRRYLAAMAVTARKGADSWSEGRNDFVREAWEYLRWSHGVADESKRQAALENLYDKETRDLDESPPGGTAAVPKLPNLGEIQLAREIDELMRDGQKLSVLHRAKTQGHYDDGLDMLRWSVAKRIDDLLSRVAASPIGKTLSVPSYLKNRVDAFDLLVQVRKHLPDTPTSGPPALRKPG